MGKIGYDELGDLMLGDKNVYSSENIRKFWYIFDKIIDNINDEVEFTENDLLTEMQRKVWESKQELMKIQTEKLELNKWLRDNARKDLFREKTIQAIKVDIGELPPIRKIAPMHNKKYGLLNMADHHFGKDFKIYGLRDEILNEYNPDIFYARMEDLFNQTLETIDKEGFTNIKVFSLGDTLDGFLRHQQLWTLKYGVIDSARIFGKYIGKWLRRLSEYVIIEYHQTSGNHTELRLLDGKKNAHDEDNIEKIIWDYIELTNEDNPNFSMFENKTGLIFTNIAGYNVLGIHGEVKDLTQAIKDYSDIYDIKIDYIIAGHKHHSDFKNCGVRKGCIGVGSIIGSDDFSMRIKKSADATASFIIFEEGKGKVQENTFVLN